MEARYIPKGTIVRKPQGQYTFRLEQELTIYAASGTRVTTVKDAAFLIGDKGINEISGNKRLCVDFKHPTLLTSWIKQHFTND